MPSDPRYVSVLLDQDTRKQLGSLLEEMQARVPWAKVTLSDALRRVLDEGLLAVQGEDWGGCDGSCDENGRKKEAPTTNDKGPGHVQEH